jgi:regulator of protease activity HflC (stomatin/prohibitin superfamily)
MSPSTSPLPDRFGAFGSRLVALLVGTALAAGLALLLLWPLVLVRIPSGHVGVLYSLLGKGTVTDRIYLEGIAFKLPWNDMYLLDTRIQAKSFEMFARTAEGMEFKVNATILFHLEPEQAATMVKEVGPNWIDTLVLPMAISAVRLEAIRYDSYSVYASSSGQFLDRVLTLLKRSEGSDKIYYVDFVMAKITLPQGVTQAIEEKLAAEQRTAKYEYLLSAQRLEAERQRIQAIGMRNFYSIVQSSLTDRLLTWRGIEATVELSKSPNTKIVVVGGSKNQMPLILGSEIQQQTAPPAGPEVTPVPGTADPLPDWTKIPPIFNDPADEYSGSRFPTQSEFKVYGKQEEDLKLPHRAAPSGSPPPGPSQAPPTK